MKPIVTWIVLINSRMARVCENRGPGKGLVTLENRHWHAAEVSAPRDKAGRGHNIVGPGVAAVEQTDRQLQSDIGFAREVSGHLLHDFSARRFDRLIIVAGPHMLGLLRAHLDDRLKAVTVGEVAKDLSAQPPDALEGHVGEVIAV